MTKKNKMKQYKRLGDQALINLKSAQNQEVGGYSGERIGAGV